VQLKEVRDLKEFQERAANDRNLSVNVVMAKKIN
jgi:hypothetical protein